MNGKVTLLDLPKDILGSILSYIICDFVSRSLRLSYGRAIEWMCDRRNVFWNLGGFYGEYISHNLSVIHPKIRKILKSQCVFKTKSWYMKRSFFVHI